MDVPTGNRRCAFGIDEAHVLGDPCAVNGLHLYSVMAAVALIDLARRKNRRESLRIFLREIEDDPELAIDAFDEHSLVDQRRLGGDLLVVLMAVAPSNGLRDDLVTAIRDEARRLQASTRG